MAMVIGTFAGCGKKEEVPTEPSAVGEGEAEASAPTEGDKELSCAPLLLIQVVSRTIRSPWNTT